MHRFAVFDTKPYDEEALKNAASEEDITFKFYDTKLSPDTASLARGCDGAVIFVNDRADDETLARLAEQNVRFLALRCAGYNNVDLAAAKKYGIRVARVPAYSPHAGAEHAMALLLCSLRRIHKAYIRTRDFNFSLNGLCGFDLYGKTVGVVGTGKIGRTFISICRGFGMKVIAYDRYPAKDTDIEYVSLEELFRRADIISLHCPLTPETEYMINEKSIAMMKKGVFIINTSRGMLIDSDALIEGIKAKKIGAACLDVYEEESDLFFEDNSGHILQDDTLARLISMPNVILTSHQGFLTSDALENIASETVKNIKEFLAGKNIENELLPPEGEK